MQQLMEEGKSETGLIVAEGFDYEMIEKMYWPHDNYGILATLKGNGEIEKTVIGSILEALILDSENEKEYSRLKEIFRAPSLQMASFTIMEKKGLQSGRRSRKDTAGRKRRYGKRAGQAARRSIRWKR